MNGGVSQLGDPSAVQARAIAFVTGEAIFRVLDVQFGHEFVAGGLCEDGCACDAQRTLVAFDECSLGNVQFGEFEAEIGQQEVRNEMKRFKGAAGGEPCGGDDSEQVDLFGGGEADAPGDGRCFDLRCKLDPLAGSHLLGIASPVQSPGKKRRFFWQDDRSDADRSCQCAASGFVQSCDVFVGVPEFLFVGQIRR